jgi:hypothetical protein
MKITGVTIIKNAIVNDYPVVESINSILPLVDEMIVAVGDSEDDTEGLIKAIGDPKIKIIHSTWDPDIRTGGKILALETNKALEHISGDTDWIFYIQADEVIHEKYYPVIREAAKQFLGDIEVQGLLFRYEHFYGTYDYVGTGRKWYDHETRIIRNNQSILSYRDAQGFRKNGIEKIKVAAIPASVYHYGWVKNPVNMKIKQKTVARFWNNDDNSLNEFLATEDFFDYNDFNSIRKFEGTHPQVMQKRIARKNWDLELDISKNKYQLKYKILNWLEEVTGIRLFSFTNHRIVRRFKIRSSEKGTFS